MRAPFEGGRSASSANSTPAFVRASLYFDFLDAVGGSCWRLRTRWHLAPAVAGARDGDGVLGGLCQGRRSVGARGEGLEFLVLLGEVSLDLQALVEHRLGVPQGLLGALVSGTTEE